ncbi:MerR family transcriptional regulator [Undibacterium sp.]|jgi:MerR family copper efflux transcriptional regulator|uniref:MerR family transcriptional regulator n=1 Tax=Undibacterium sp. TaxID=1914977 RepID=UPI002D0387BD|nr:MerR family transcriptional regulator [Undibacterium sp.]HTD03989.1 MerR family transcriptional regulator [Undibacterium sp.]
MKIGELAAKAAMAPSAIRFYEQSGLLPPAARGANGYRVYSSAALDRLRVIQLAQNLGFHLDAIRSLFASGQGFPKVEVLDKLDKRLLEIKQAMAMLRSQREDLQALRATLSQSWEAGECLELDALVSGMGRKPE